MVVIPPCHDVARHAREDHIHRISCAIGFAFLEIALDERHLVGHMSEGQHGLAARFREGIERGRLHLDGEQAFVLHRGDGFFGLAERRVGGPGRTAVNRDPQLVERALHHGQESVIGGTEWCRRSVMITGPFVAQRAVDQDEVRWLLQRKKLA